MKTTAKILIGDTREQLRTVEAGSVRMVCTSPPYWGHRNYGTNPQIWGADPECQHEWGDSIPQVNPTKHADTLDAVVPADRGACCVKCGAWRGELGNEPTPEMFCRDMTEVFAEVWRILADDGTLWLNMGDSWNAYNGNRGAAKGANKNAHISMPSLPAGHGLTCKTLKAKDLTGIPWMLAFALRTAGWYLRQEIIWAKPNGMPESVRDRCTSSHESVFLLSKQDRYFSDFDAIKTPPREASLVRTAQNVQAQAGSHRANGGAKTNGTMKAVGVRTDKQRGHSRKHAGFNERWDEMEKSEQQSKPAQMRDVWFISPATYDDAHFAVMPEELARRCILAGSEPGDTVCDPFTGTGTTALVANALDRNFIGTELNPEFEKLARKRLRRGYDPTPRAIILPNQKDLFADAEAG